MSINISGVPNLGIPGMGGGAFFGGVPNYAPAMSADQINASMGLDKAHAFNQPALYGGGSFGAQTDYYSGLGAAYGRATGGFGAPGSNPGWQTPDPSAGGGDYGKGGGSVFDTGTSATPYAGLGMNAGYGYGFDNSQFLKGYGGGIPMSEMFAPQAPSYGGGLFSGGFPQAGGIQLPDAGKLLGYDPSASLGLGGGFGGYSPPQSSFMPEAPTTMPSYQGGGLFQGGFPNAGGTKLSDPMRLLGYDPSAGVDPGFAGRWGAAPPIDYGLQPPSAPLPQGIYDGVFAPTTPYAPGFSPADFNSRFGAAPYFDQGSFANKWYGLGDLGRNAGSPSQYYGGSQYPDAMPPPAGFQRQGNGLGLKDNTLTLQDLMIPFSLPGGA